MDVHTPVDVINKTIDQLTPEEKWRYEHQKLHQKHAGHESMHAEMIFILIATVVISQICLIEWKKRHYHSYSFVTLLGMWTIPFGISLYSLWWRFIFFWLIFSCITGFIGIRALQSPIQGTTPRLVYKWFYFLYKLSLVLGIIGYGMVMATFAGVNLIFNQRPHSWMDLGFLLLFYGLYYGVLGRDIAEICADKIASKIGYYTREGIPTRQLESNMCAVCGNYLVVDTDDDNALIETSYRLSCSHVFHEFCIRGWCMVGKKQTCPYCHEKVDLKNLFRNPWERPHILYGQLLDWLRWLIAWQPLILSAVQGIIWFLGLE
ncbi:RING finger protein 121 [Ctenocephalides felis]|uniref:RING finger protein 121 n=1 Tax=Ctenocephalides felis TaxID=7515 RepID=UPI000E6E17B0|nr:RING finger protein 121 [Ctenocephalides felis]